MIAGSEITIHHYTFPFKSAFTGAFFIVYFYAERNCTTFVAQQ
jgi:hypothetical protein